MLYAEDLRARRRILGAKERGDGNDEMSTGLHSFTSQLNLSPDTKHTPNSLKRPVTSSKPPVHTPKTSPTRTPSPMKRAYVELKSERV